MKLTPPQTPTLSVIIANYNYEKFVGAAIESVLSQNQDVQIIVVDDASTDGSVDVINRYADRVETILLKQNRGQGGGLNAGFTAATGTLVMFLDADDFLVPGAVDTLFAHYDPAVAIYHFRMHYGDEDGETFGIFPPMERPLAEGNVSERLRTEGHYDGTVASGLVYSREAVANVMPMDEETYRYGADGYLSSTVPLYGESATITTPISAYRLHTRQHSQFKKVYAERARWRLKHTMDRHNSTREHAEKLNLAVSPDLFENDAFALQERVVSMIIEPEEHPIEGDTLKDLLARSKARKMRQASGPKRIWEFVWWTMLQLAPGRLRIAMIKPAIDADARLNRKVSRSMLRPFVDNKVAIVIAVFNDRDHIARAIQSAAAQALPDGYELDVIVVDDCSTDDTYDIALDASRDRATVRVFQLDKNGGPSRARNEALRHSDAAWYLPLDSDDAMAPDRLRKLLAVAKAEQADLVADNLFITHADAPFEVVRSLWPGKPDGVLPLTTEFFVRHCYDMPESRSELGYVKPLISRRMLTDPVSPYRDELRFAEDYELYTRLLLDGAKAVLTDGLGYYFIQRAFSSSRSQAGDEHRRVAMIDRAFLKRADLTRAERRAIKGHLAYSKKEWANWTLIEAGRERDIGKLISGLFISPSAPWFLLRSVVRKLVPSKSDARAS